MTDNGRLYEVSGKGLKFLAGLLWVTAGVNVVRMGVNSWLMLDDKADFWLIAGMLVTFLAFGSMFYRLTVKNIKRIGEYPGKAAFWHCMSLKSYLIMAFMITFGVMLRNFTPTPPSFIAPFYCGLGTALFLAGVLYFIRLRS